MNHLARAILAAVFTGSLVIGAASPALAADSTPALTLNPASTVPGSTVQVVGTFTATANASFEVNINVQGTNGEGTFTDPGPVSGLDSCGLDLTLRSFKCTWNGAQIGQQRAITLNLNVGAGATPGQGWPVGACSNPNTQSVVCDFGDVTIASSPPPPTSTPPTSSSSPTPTPEPTTTAGSSGTGTAALPTAVPAGREPLPGDAGGPAMWVVAGALFAVAAGSAIWGSRAGRRAT